MKVITKNKEFNLDELNLSRLGIFCGTFDPIHEGHLFNARYRIAGIDTLDRPPFPSNIKENHLIFSRNEDILKHAERGFPKNFRLINAGSDISSSAMKSGSVKFSDKYKKVMHLIKKNYPNAV